MLTFAPDALRAITLHGWPGNVRELQNRVQRAVIMAEGKRVTAADLELSDVARQAAATDAERGTGTSRTGDCSGRLAA